MRRWIAARALFSRVFYTTLQIPMIPAITLNYRTITTTFIQSRIVTTDISWIVRLNSADERLNLNRGRRFLSDQGTGRQSIRKEVLMDLV